MKIHKTGKLTVPTLALAAFMGLAQADGVSQNFNIPAQPLADALLEFSRQTNINVLAAGDLVEGIESGSVKGDYEPLRALEKLLQGSGVSYRLKDDNSIQIEKKVSGKVLRKQSQREPLPIFEEIVVTAQKREQRLVEVPMSVAALSGRQMAEAGITDLQSLSLAVPGVLVADSGSSFRRISIRGIGNIFGTSSLVGIYLDEASMVGTSANQLDLRIHDIERVEVLKGPQGTLYGEGSVGGTIRFITKDPQLDEFTGRVSLNASSTRNGDISQEVKSVVNLPLAESLGLRLVGQYVNSGGWIDQPALSKKDINNYELFNLRGKLLWEPTDNLEIKTTAIVHRGDFGAENIGEDGNGNYRQPFDVSTTPSSTDNYDLLSVLINYDFDDFTLVSATSYLDIDKKRKNFGGQCCDLVDESGERLSILQPWFSTTAEVVTQELRLSSSGVGSWNWTAGLFYKHAEMIPLNSLGVLFGVPGGELGEDLFEFGSAIQDERSRSWALFGETSYALTDSLEVGAGLRYFEDDRKQRNSPTGPFQEETFDSLNPKLYMSYAVSADIRVYANMAKGFRSGGFNGAGEPPFDPEEVISYELGTKMALYEGRVNAEVALFYSDYKDYQVAGVIPELGLNVTSNAGQAKINGVDFSLRALVTEQLELGFTGNYMDTEFVKIDVTSTSHAEGDPLDLVPRYGYSLWSNYSFSWPDRSPGFFRLDYNQQGESHFRNRTFGPDYHSTSDVIDMLNARIGWENNNWTLELYGLNLLDDSGFNGPVSIEGASARSRPRTLGLSVGLSL